MKNIVMEIQGKYAVLMNSAGDFIRIKNQGYSVGQRLEVETAKPKATWVKWAVAAASAFVILLGGGAYAYYTPYADMSMDINPSIEISTNIFDAVIGVKAMNEDAERLLAQIQLKDCDMPTAMAKLVDELIEEGYLAPEEKAELMLTVCSQDQERARTMLQDMTKALKKEMDQKRVQANIQGECIGEELKIRARELGVSPGKLRLAEQYALSTGDPSKVNIEDWLNKPVRDIVAATHANQARDNGDIPANGSQNQDGYMGGDLNDNGYNGGDQSGNGQNAGDTNQNGYNGGDKSDNGYNGGEDIDNDENSDTPGPSDTGSGQKKGGAGSPDSQDSGSQNQTGSDNGNGNTGGNTDAGNTGGTATGTQDNGGNPTGGNDTGNQTDTNKGSPGGRK